MIILIPERHNSYLSGISLQYYKIIWHNGIPTIQHTKAETIIIGTPYLMMSFTVHHSEFPYNNAAIGDADGVNNAKWQLYANNAATAKGFIPNWRENG